MSLSSEAQALFDHARNAIPRWLTGAASAALEWLFAFTEIFDEVRAQGQDWLDITYIQNAVGAELDQHAADRGTSRRSGESDTILRDRLTNITDALTEPVLRAGVDSILTNLGKSAFLDVNDYSITGWNTRFVALAAGGSDIRLSMVSNGTNPPTIVESGRNITINYSAGVTTRSAVETLVDGDSTLIQVDIPSASGGTALAAGDAFANKRFQLSAFVVLRRDRAHCHTNGNCKAFMNRGYRMASVNRPMGYVVILPYLQGAAISVTNANAIKEYLRKNGPGGFQYYVERRLNP